jgi:hypothetical protein
MLMGLIFFTNEPKIVNDSYAALPISAEYDEWKKKLISYAA